jgi:hypothetical protein
VCLISWTLQSGSEHQCCGSKIIFLDPDLTLTLIPVLDPDPGCLKKKKNLNCKSADHLNIAKSSFFKTYTFFYQFRIVDEKYI